LVLKAASAVHVGLVRWAREKEKIHASLKDFISDVAPSHLTSGLPVASQDNFGLLQSASETNSEGMIANQFRFFKNSFKSVLSQASHAPSNKNSDGTPRSNFFRIQMIVVFHDSNDRLVQDLS
jgi:hypothetical protein